MKISEWKANFARSFPEGYEVSIGWLDEDHGFTWEAYKSEVKDKVAAVEEGDDMPKFVSFREWKLKKRYENPYYNDLGFEHTDCDTCKSGLSGNRHPATAMKNRDHDSRYTLRICDDCWLYRVKGVVPDFLEEG